MGRTACTEPQCLYNGYTLYIHLYTSAVSVILPFRTQSLQPAFLGQHIWGTSGDKAVDM